MQASCQTARRPVSNFDPDSDFKSSCDSSSASTHPCCRPSTKRPTALGPTALFCCLSEMHKNQIIFLFFICFTLLRLPPRPVLPRSALDCSLFFFVLYFFKHIYINIYTLKSAAGWRLRPALCTNWQPAFEMLKVISSTIVDSYCAGSCLHPALRCPIPPRALPQVSHYELVPVEVMECHPARSYPASPTL